MTLRNNSTLLQRGQTYPSGTDSHLLGQRMIFPNKDYSVPNMAPDRDQGEVEMVFVKNNSGGALTGGLCVKFKTSADTDFGVNVAGATGAGDTPDGVVDEFLPAAGVADGDYFLLAVKGPTTLVSDGSGSLSRGDVVVTAASGKVKKQVAAPADTTAAMVQVNSKVGRVRAAATNVDGTKFMGEFGKN